MKTKIIITSLILAAFMSIFSPAFAGDPKTETTIGFDSVPTGSVVEYGKEILVVGVVEQDSSGVFLLNNGETKFFLEGVVDISKSKGLTVEVTGVLKKGEGVDILIAKEIKPLKA